MTKTKKVGSTGRFGARYGLKIRKSVLAVEQIQKRKHKCPYCLKFRIKRLASGIWLCNYCKNKFAGLAYEPGPGRPVLEVAQEEAKEKEILKKEDKKEK